VSSLVLGQRLDYLAEGWRPWVLLLLLSLSLFVPGLTNLPPVDRDEARYIQATRQMLETGDLVQIRFQDEARNKKPVGIYWLQSALVGSLSNAEATAVWPYRLASVIGATAAVLLTFLFGSVIFERRVALIGAGLLASTANLVYTAHIATTDAVQLACIVAAAWRGAAQPDGRDLLGGARPRHAGQGADRARPGRGDRPAADHRGSTRALAAQPEAALGRAAGAADRAALAGADRDPDRRRLSGGFGRA
jgi:hypothetical protein